MTPEEREVGRRSAFHNASVNVAKLAGVGLVVAALSACGSSHVARPRDYSVKQVKRAFAAHGITLHRARYGPAAGVVKLSDHNVEVDVARGHGTEWLSASTVDLRSTAVGNVIVTYPPSQTAAIKAALRSLQA
jgi:hypothetical protein